MVDIPGNSTTTATIGVGETVSNSLELVGDHDWFRISLTAGQSINVLLDGITLEDAYLRIYNSSGQLLYENDDINPGIVRDSQLAFTATYSGNYYIDVGAWDENYTGTYQLSVSTYTPPPLGTVEQLADQLVNGYWGGDDHHFNVTQGGSLTVNLTALTAAGQTLARAALAEWTKIIGVTFVEVSSGGKIIFDDNQEGAFSDSNWSGGIISSSHVNVSTDWLATYGTGLNTYSFQTYIHEIGHALGLGHQGNYNGEARYPFDAEFQNDSWPMSVMSYFDQVDNTYFAGQGFDFNYLLTPMMADIYAMSLLYGLSTTTNTGNDTYYGNLVGAMCIFDSGGTDAIYSPWGGPTQLINLNSGTFSNVGGHVGNLSIALGVTIENATSAAGNDTLIGNHVANVLDGGDGNDAISGGAGDDTLIGGNGSDSLDGGDGIDTAVFGPSAVSANLSLGIATSGGASDTLTAIENMIGSTEGDTLIGSNAANVISGSSGDDFIDGAEENDTLNGDAFNDTIHGGGGDDILRGGTGDDILDGGAQTDRAMYDDATAAVTVNLATGVSTTTNGNWDGVGTDTLFNIENVTGSSFGDTISGNGDANVLDGGGGNDVLDGSDGADQLFGGSGNDSLDGGTGADQLSGGTGNDTYYVDQAGDIVTEVSGEGSDEVRASFSYALNANVENLRLTGAAAISGFGNALDNSLRGNDAANMLLGAGGNDKLYGNGGDDTLDGGEGDDYLYGLIGNDTLGGGNGYDRMYGGVGDDTYYANDADDYAYENAGEGTDQVIASIDHQLRVNVENLTLIGSAVIGKGNDLGNAITGGANGNRLYGYGGDDALNGGDGDDYLFGDAGNDSLTGGTGYDRMYGGVGNDTYYVNDATDYAYENLGEGVDRVVTSVNHVLRANIEQLELGGNADLRGWGNAEDNLILGNSGANLLYGKDGNDLLQGAAGNDILYGENGNDSLDGGAGQDRYYGGSGADSFLFGDGDLAGLTSSTADRIHDFSQLDGDKISLEAVDADTALGGDQGFSFLGNGAFTGHAGELRAYQASGNTYVVGDTDGDGIGDFMIRLDGLHTLQASDFLM